MASRNNMVVMVVIHANKGCGSIRGHLCPQIECECAGLISIGKDGERRVHSIESRLIRVCDDFETVYFYYSEHEKKMMLCDATHTAELKV